MNSRDFFLPTGIAHYFDQISRHKFAQVVLYVPKICRTFTEADTVNKCSQLDRLVFGARVIT